MDTTDGFHTYVIVARSGDLKVYLADSGLRLILDAKGSNDDSVNKNYIMFGDLTGHASGSAYWDYVRYRKLSPQEDLPGEPVDEASE